MAIKRYFATKDNTITNAFKSNLLTRATGSNMGASDILEAFVIHGQTSASVNARNAEQSRILVQFPVDDMLSDISDGTVPSSSVEYRLKMFNAPHADSTPLGYNLEVALVNKDWNEGTGLDMDAYKDLGASNWVNASASSTWTWAGGDYLTAAAYSANFYFSGGLEDIDLDVNYALNRWRTDSNHNHGLILKHTNAVISGTKGTFFTKKFFGRNSEFHFKQPYIEARWDSGRKDHRANFLISSSLATPSDNLNTLYLYNNVRGQLKLLPNVLHDRLLVKLYSGSLGVPTGHSLHLIDSDGLAVREVTASLLVENGVDITGTYTCSFASTSSLDVIYDVWYSGSVQYFTGSYEPQDLQAQALIYEDEYITDITNLRSSYIKGQKPRLRVFSRKKNWQPNIYNIATSVIDPETVEDSYYRVFRTVDNMEIIPFGTGSYSHTRMSYDISGSYFQLDTSYLEPGYSYGIQFCYYLQGQYREQPEVFKFRIDESN
jgi:hypothetical protein|tara:strand:- start:417 stop:1886 length:1470 start_codon:yes stop_codon:yes gene_type:complete